MQQQSEEERAKEGLARAGQLGVTAQTLCQAEKIANIELSPSEREQVLAVIAKLIDSFEKRRQVAIPNALAPAEIFRPKAPAAPAQNSAPKPPRFARSADPGNPLPDSSLDIAFAPVTQLSRWIESNSLSSRRLTEIYLERLKKIGPKLNCTITLVEQNALKQADRADREKGAGIYRGPLHGIPWGAKDLLDTAGIATTWGATPYRDRVPEQDATVVRKLDQAGAVLTAKLSLGALANGDVWFGGRTNNPWNLEQGSDGSSAGSAAATAAGLVGFSIGSETHGSIVAPCMRCGATGLRPTFGRVGRAGAMALSWSFDKLGPICRSVEDTALVLACINGPDQDDPSSSDVPFVFDAATPVAGLRAGYMPQWFSDEQAIDIDRETLRALEREGLKTEEIEIPELPYRALGTLIGVEAAAAFEDLTLSGRDDQLRRQDLDAWPNAFRRNRFIPAVEYVQIQRFRRLVMDLMDALFADIDVLICPSFVGPLGIITNSTGHPSLTLPAGRLGDGTPHGITLYGGLYEEGTLCNVGAALERQRKTPHLRPPVGA